MNHVETVAHCAQLLRRGIANRITSATTMNAHSSRSHAVFTVYVKITQRSNGHDRRGSVDSVYWWFLVCFLNWRKQLL